MIALSFLGNRAVRYALAIAGATLALAAIETVSTDSYAQQVLKAESPVYKIGDSWKYRIQNIADRTAPTEYSNQVAEVTAESTWISGQNVREKFWWRWESKPAKFTQRYLWSEEAADKRGVKTIDQTDSEPDIRFPLEVGKSYRVAFKWINTSGEPGDSQLNADVVAYEKVKVPAGEFDAFKISMRGRWNNRSSHNSDLQEITVWYAPSVKREVKRETKGWFRGQVNPNTVTELIEYSLAN